MYFTDTHTHLYDEAFFRDGGTPSDAVRRGIQAGVEKMILPGCTFRDLEGMYALKADFPENIYLAAGLHPTEFPEGAEATEHELHLIEERLRNRTGDFVAVGEIGLDFYWDKSRAAEQIVCFDRQCRLAAELGLPVIIHCRESLAETLGVLRALPVVPRGVFHSFSGTAEDVAAVRAVGDFYFGINGIVTFKNSSLAGVLPEIPRDRLLLETDSPYLAPVPRRGTRNESANIPYIAERVASALGITAEETAGITTANAIRLFGGIA